MSNKKIPPIHPGEILLEEFLKPMGLSQNKIALDIRVPAPRLNLRGDRAVCVSGHSLAGQVSTVGDGGLGAQPPVGNRSGGLRR